MRITLEPWERSQDGIHSENKGDSEITKVDLTQEGREFIDEFERDFSLRDPPGLTVKFKLPMKPPSFRGTAADSRVDG
jgi:hypothetical protein